MHRRQFLRVAIASAIAAMVVLSVPPGAQANLVVVVKVNGTGVDGTATGLMSFGAGGQPGSTNNGAGQTYTSGGTTFSNVSISITSNVPGSAGVGTLNTVSVTGSGASGSPGTLEIDVFQSTSYSVPGGSPLTLISGVSRTDGQLSNTLTYQSWIGNSSGLSVGTTPGQQTQDQTKLNTAPPNTLSTNFSPTSPGTYFLSSILTFNSTLDSQNPNINVNGSTRVVGVPEPSTIAMVFGGLPVLGMLWTRRRQRS